MESTWKCYRVVPRILSRQYTVLHTYKTSGLPPRELGQPQRNVIKIYLDDERATPEGWHRVYWPEEAILLLEAGIVSEISLDHDLGDDTHGTGYDVVVWIEEAVITKGFVPPTIWVHSANASARQKMEAGIRTIYKRAGNES